MAGRAAAVKAPFADEEARLARAAAAGDGSAFATLYERYERRVYNLAYRVTGSESDAADATQEAFLRAMRQLPKPQDREPPFGPYLFIATRNACYDLMEKRRPTMPSDARPETAAGEVRDANMRLPEHQREALALRELEELSYDEIAAIMEMTHNSVAQLIYRARINLRDEMGGTVLATVAAPSPECERALPLIAAREDGQLEAGSDDDAWLDAHLAGCERCRLGVEVMHEAGGSYRAWAPIAAVPWLLEETMAKAAALANADWSEAISEAIASRADPRSPSGMPPAYLTGRGGEDWSSRRRRRAIAAAGLAVLLLGGGIATVLAGSEPSPIPDQPAADAHPAASIPASKPGSKSQKKKRGSRGAPRTETESQATTLASPLLTEAGGSAPAAPPANHQGASGLQPPQAIFIPKPKPTRSPPSQPASAPAPPAAAQPSTEPPAEDPSKEHPSKGRGPPAGVPPTR